ncbi:hypothetical protein BGZ63DRAFT_439553 [Mariannaea sp. PMI_226]|nr:hypothetical protein BGZ63DRAFT_439553 [Mariannaea sp. PMI_226]
MYDGLAIWPWCGLCNFEFQVDDDIVVPNRDRENRLEGLRFLGRSLDEVRERQRYLDMQLIYEDSPGSMPSGCHHACVNFIERASPMEKSYIEWAYMNAVSYDYVPSSLEFDRRRRWWQDKLFGVSLIKSKSLPTEVTVQIVQNCLSELFLAYIQPLIGLNVTQGFSYPIYTTEQIWAQWVKFEDRLYIAALSNEPPGDAKHCVALQMPEGEVDSIYVAHDQLGIRNILLANSRETVAVRRCPGIWWRTISVRDNAFTTYCDGIKLRRLNHGKLGPMREPYYAGVLWATPQPLATPIRFHKVSPCREISRMNFFECNRSDTRAYSACWDGEIITIHTHSRAEKDLDFYRRRSDRDFWQVWLYMPVDQGEHITEIWKRPEKDQLLWSGHKEQKFTLVMKTNNGRVWVIGEHWRNRRSKKSWVLVDQPTQVSSRIFIEECYLGMGYMAFESPEPLHNQPNPPIPIPRSPYPICSQGHDYFYSSAPLIDVAMIYPCRYQLEHTSAIVGLLLCYHDGRERSVGQVRLDSLEHAICVEATTQLVYRLSPDKAKVLEVRVGEEFEGDEWIGIPWVGSLEWWHSARDSRLYHDESP